MAAKVGRNERSWVIDLISKINEFTSHTNLKIKKAGGENTIQTHGVTMFPDVLLYGNQEQSIILQGWEAKMPDVPINDAAFVADAQRKARALNLNSCVLWNFTYVHLYLLDKETNQFKLAKDWTDTSFIQSREDVQTYRKDWESLLQKVLLELNQWFLDGRIEEASLGEALSSNILSLLIARNKDLVANSLQSHAVSDARIGAAIDHWWNTTKAEYQYDESNPYKAYAKTIILNWSNRIIFAYAIQKWQNPASAVKKIDATTSPEEANLIFEEITRQCDFFNIFSAVPYDTLIPVHTWKDFVELSGFLKDNGASFIDQTILQHVLENTVASAKREMDGLFTTPVELAKLLALLTVKNWTADVLDPCCGTGTIARAVLAEKKDKLGPAKAVATVWASDKNEFPLQVANISMADHDTIFLPNRIFQHNALSLRSGETIKIVDPVDGKEIALKLPKFGAIVSNLPFVAFEKIPADDLIYVHSVPYFRELNKRSDLYEYITMALADLLVKKGQLGVILSNSWLGTIAGDDFITVLQQRFQIKQVHISGSGRWFQNADVVTTILLLEENTAAPAGDTLFCLWKKSLNGLEDHPEWEQKLVQSSLLEQEIDPSIVRLSRYSAEQMHKLRELNLSYNSFFHRVNWLLDIADKTVEIQEVFHVFRGSRRGWDAMFYPAPGHGIEKQYLRKVLINAKHVKRLVTAADKDAFCCGKSIQELEQEGSLGTLHWIHQFERQVNGVGKKLPLVLARRGMQWYELRDTEIADIFTMMNPDKRLFFAKFDTPSFINQRLVGLKAKDDYPDIAFEHALLNSLFTMFYIEAVGFGRGLGALDINKKSIAGCRMLNPKLVSPAARAKIMEAFEPLLHRDIKTVREELASKDRIAFEKTVLKAYGMEDYFASIIYSLLSMQNTRLCVKGTVTPFDTNDLYGYQDIREAATSVEPLW